MSVQSFATCIHSRQLIWNLCHARVSHRGLRPAKEEDNDGNHGNDLEGNKNGQHFVFPSPKNSTPLAVSGMWKLRMYLRGLILFWVYDGSAGQKRTMVLYEKTLKMVMVGIKLAGNPFLRPLHKLAAELLEVI